MNTYLRPLSVLFLFGFLTWSCSMTPCGGSKAGLIKKVQALAEKAGETDWGYSDERWTRYDRQMETLLDDCLPDYEDDMTMKEQKDVLVAASKYYYKRYGKGFFKDIFGKKKGFLPQFKSLTEEGVNELTEEIEKDVEDWARQIEEMFK